MYLLFIMHLLLECCNQCWLTKMRDIKNRRAVSPVIATVILVAVAITIAVAVSYWMGGISSQYTRFEKIEVTSAYSASGTVSLGPPAVPDPNWGIVEDFWEVTLDLRNTGTTEASIINCFVNSKAVGDYGQKAAEDNMLTWDDTTGTEVEVNFASGDKVTVTPGESAKIILRIVQTPGTASDYSFTSGTTIEVALSSGAGNTYMKMVTLS